MSIPIPTVLIASVVSLALLAADAVSAAAGGITELVASVRDTAVKVHVRELVFVGTDSIQRQVEARQGSGVLIAPDGLVLTAAHVVQTADEVFVEFNDGIKVAARVFASEPAADVALLELDAMPPGRSLAPLADSDGGIVGQQVVLISFPYDLGVTATVGRVSGQQRPPGPFGPFEPLELLVTDACVLKGCSGGPLFDLDGRVMGAATSIMTNRGLPSGLGFIVSARTVRALLFERRSLWTGIGGYWISGRLAHAMNLPQRAGLLVMRIAADSPASRLRLQGGTAPTTVGEQEFVLGGDIILSIQGVSLADPLGYQRASAAMAALADGDTLRMTVLRGGEQVELESTLKR
ncbi:MAG: trypsin-like peptidase domain-containing protein [Burkholderiales bacterium]|nr:MAG: trypsin-like peptidase domain-containing protein [Burkholderiales bacterium]